MKSLLFLLLMSLGPLSNAGELDRVIKELQGPNLSLKTIAALVALEDRELQVGYGLCEAAGQPFCKPEGSVGYGLCTVAEERLCKENGSIGYGLCMLSGTKNCQEDGSIGYGMCVLAGEKFCKP